VRTLRGAQGTEDQLAAKVDRLTAKVEEERALREESQAIIKEQRLKLDGLEQTLQNMDNKFSQVLEALYRVPGVQKGETQEEGTTSNFSLSP